SGAWPPGESTRGSPGQRRAAIRGRRRAPGGHRPPDYRVACPTRFTSSAASRIRRGNLTVVHEVARAGGIHQLRREPWRLAEEGRERERLIDEIARLAAAQRDPVRPIVVLEHVLDDRSVERNLFGGAVVLEDADEIGDGGALREDLVLNPAEKRLVGQLGRLQVGGEHEQDHERDLEALAALEREEVDAA